MIDLRGRVSRQPPKQPQRIKVIVLAQTPPPYGGQAVMMQHLLDGTYEHASLVHVRMNFSREISEMRRFQVRKVGHLATLIVRVLLTRVRQKASVLYFPPSGPTLLPVARDMALLLATRWMFSQTVLHFQASGISELYVQMPTWLRWLFRRAYFGADAAIRLSSAAPEDPTALRAKREFIVPNATVDCCDGLPIRAHGNGLPIVLFVGVLRESKGVLLLLEAAARLTALGLSFRVQLMGEPESETFRSRLAEHVVRLGLRDRIELLGVLADDAKAKAFRAATIFCFPTYFDSEGMPVSVVEAMMFGLPVVASRWRSIPELVVDTETGFLVEPRDVDGITARLQVLIEDPQLAAQMGMRGRLRYKAEYTVARFQQRIDTVFEQLATPL